MSLKYFEKIVEPAALKCTLGEHSFKNDNPNDVKLSKLIQFARFTKRAPPCGCACQLHRSRQNH